MKDLNDKLNDLLEHFGNEVVESMNTASTAVAILLSKDETIEAEKAQEIALNFFEEMMDELSNIIQEAEDEYQHAVGMIQCTLDISETVH